MNQITRGDSARWLVSSVDKIWVFQVGQFANMDVSILVEITPVKRIEQVGASIWRSQKTAQENWAAARGCRA